MGPLTTPGPVVPLKGGTGDELPGGHGPGLSTPSPGSSFCGFCPRGAWAPRTRFSPLPGVQFTSGPCLCCPSPQLLCKALPRSLMPKCGRPGLGRLVASLPPQTSRKRGGSVAWKGWSLSGARSPEGGSGSCSWPRLGLWNPCTEGERVGGRRPAVIPFRWPGSSARRLLGCGLFLGRAFSAHL